MVVDMHPKMAAGHVLYKLSISIITVLFISLILTTEMDKNLAHDASSIFVMTEAHIRTFPSRNSGMKRQQCSTGIKSPSCKVNAGIKLMKLSLGASYLVLLAGDVSLNPGPIIDPCAVCKKGCRRNQCAIQCDECDLWYHAKCTALQMKIIKVLLSQEQTGLAMIAYSLVSMVQSVLNNSLKILLRRKTALNQT